MFLILLCSSVILFLIYFYLKQNYEFWTKKRIPHPKPNLFFGNLRDSLFLKKSLGQLYADIYNDFPDLPYVGIYKLRTAAVMLRDPELVHAITIKDFNHFIDNDFTLNEDLDPMLGRNPFFLKGQRWRTARSQLTACFTSGKLKTMFPFMIKVTKDLIHYLKDNGNAGSTTFEVKELSAQFTTDNVASCAFGLEGNSFIKGDDEFRKIGKMVTTPSFIHGLKLLVMQFFPGLAPILKARFVPKEADKYFRRIVFSTLQYRKDNNIVRNDFLDIVSQLLGKEANYTQEDVLAHSFSFFGDGFETGSITLSFTLYELATNLHEQEKARNEVRSILSKNDGNLTFEGVQEMHYLDCIISESLRLHPPFMHLFKLCTKAYDLPAINGNKENLRLEPGTPVVIPVYALHYDQKNYPEPEKFDPERFSDENKSRIFKGSYLPFGQGPRMCLGQRFAMIQVKAALATLLNNFDMRVNKKTKVPLELDERYFLLITKGGLWLDFFQRSDVV